MIFDLAKVGFVVVDLDVLQHRACENTRVVDCFGGVVHTLKHALAVICGSEENQHEEHAASEEPRCAAQHTNLEMLAAVKSRISAASVFAALRSTRPLAGG